MNIYTGELLDAEEVKRLPMEEQSKYIHVSRDLTKSEKLSMQVKLYSPCACGSGRKFKFCCHKK